ncbi:MAG: PQQ-dependent sugar dehydrogenase [Planctomycetaceae bacterium]|nr:PQQ-dependent sugar dehydrogenase [Planctomycetaceae bacterium]
MTVFRSLILIAGLALVLTSKWHPAQAEPAGSSAETSDAPLKVTTVGLDHRIPWMTSRITGSPEPPSPYLAEQVFPALTFDNPLDITTAPGMDRLWIAEQGGKVYSFPNRPDVASADLAIDVVQTIEGVKQLYALTFHPDFERNRYCYLCCIRDSEQEDGSRILRFQVSETEPPTIDPASETVMITWLSGGHNGCAIKFGPDGCLYISTGDGTGPNPPDTLQAGQDVSNLLSAILRIDVDHAEDGRNYRIPPDNPFVDLPGARPEIWAYGFRNPWRMSFDRKTGDLWVGDVGWELWEMLDRVERGGNYGWGVMEGRQPTNPEWPRGPTPILPPTIDHPHSESSSITAGVTYYGTRLPELVGAHIYGDYDTGKIWAARWENGTIAWRQELADTTHRIVGFGDDQTGEMYYLHHIGGTIHRLIPNPDRSQPSSFPQRLSETGLFTSAAHQTPAPGVISYSINAEPWEDGAVAQRFVAVPGEEQITTAEAGWTFPEDAVLAKTLSWPVGSGDDARLIRLETQVRHFNGKEWQAYSYRWNDEQSDAVLVDAAGEDRMIPIPVPHSSTETENIRWHFASRTECLRCHNPWSGSALAFQTHQLNRQHDYGGVSASQLDTLFHIGLCTPEIVEEQRPALASPRDPQAGLAARARAYLHTNCAHCHRMHAGSSVLSKMQYDLPLEECTMVGERPSQGTFGIPAAHVITPGEPYQSVLLYRISKVGSGRMPHIGSQQVDADGVALIEAWIRSLPSDTGDDQSVDATMIASSSGDVTCLVQLQSAADASTAEPLVDHLLSSTSGALRLLRAVDDGRVPPSLVPVVVERGSSHPAIPVRDLFERFLPEEKRVRRLGSVVRPEEILALSGDAAHGRQLFFETEGVQCRNCHQIKNVGRDLGPRLDEIGKKHRLPQLLESILEPSKVIDPKYVMYLVETDDGRIHTGLLVKKDADEVVLRDAQDKLIHIPANQVEQLVAQSTSLMPELLVRDLTAQQLADLLAFLSSLQ